MVDNEEMSEEQRRAFARAYKLIIDMAREKEAKTKLANSTVDEVSPPVKIVTESLPQSTASERLEGILEELESLTFDELCELHTIVTKLVAKKAAEGFGEYED